MEVGTIFIPIRYPPEVWEKYRRDGFRLCRYLALPASEIVSIDAERFLLEGRDIFVTSSIYGGEQDYCVLAKLFEPGGRAACLRTDRDYFEICIRDSEGTQTVAYWQWAYALRGCRQDELWSNMANFLQSPLPE